MEIIRLPNSAGATIAFLTLSNSYGGRVQGTLKVQSANTGFMEQGEYETAKQAEAAAIAIAEQRQAILIVIEDNT